MKQLKIKFSHKYVKFPKLYTPSQLIEIFKVHFRDLHNEFLNYDTKTLIDGAYYKLPDDYLIVLILLADNNRLWTTIRRYTEVKYKYYEKNIGSFFDIVVV